MHRLLHANSLLRNKILLAIITIQILLVVVRTIHLYVTGFMSSDEATYVLYAMAGKEFGNRLLFSYGISFLFNALAIHSVSKFVVLFPFYASFWSVLFILVCYWIVGLLVHNSAARNFAVFSMLFLWSYSLLSVGFLSETPALALCAIGVYSWLLFERRGSKYYLVGALASLAAAAYLREPYVIFPIATALAIPPLLFRGRLRYLTYLVVVPLVALASQRYEPLYSQVVRWLNAFTPSSGAIDIAGGLVSSVVRGSNLVAFAVPEFVTGMFLGWSPLLFLVGAMGFLIVLRRTFRRRIPISYLFLSLISFAAFLGEIIVVGSSLDFYLGQGVSTLLRFSSPTIIAYLLLSPFFFDRLSGRQRKIFGVVLIGFTITTFGIYSEVTQSHLQLPYNAFSFDNKYGPLLAREYFLSNLRATESTAVFIAWDWKAGQVYLFGLQGVSYYPSTFATLPMMRSPLSENLFKHLRPTEFYVLSAGPLQKTVNDSISTLGIADPPTFLRETYSNLFNQTFVSTDNQYSIASVGLVFNVPTGHLLKVTAEWQQNSTSASG